jgi:hypothetical protein
MGGADWVPTTVAELDDYVERMRPQMAMTYQTAEFIGFLAGRVGEQGDHAQGALRSLGRHPRVDGPDARVGALHDRHVSAVAGVPARVRAERSAEGEGRPLGLPGAALQGIGAGARRRRPCRVAAA